MSDKTTRLRKKSRHRAAQFMILLDEDDRRLLDESAELEKLNRSDVLRRALREYHRKISRVAIAS